MQFRNNKKLRRHLADRAKHRLIETIISTDVLELLVLLCSFIMQQYTEKVLLLRPVSQTNITSYMEVGERASLSSCCRLCVTILVQSIDVSAARKTIQALRRFAC